MKYWFLIFMAMQTSMAVAYDQKHIKINDSSYQRYIKPQIISILGDYKRLLISFNADFSGVSKSFDYINQIYKASTLSDDQNLDQVLTNIYLEIKESKLKAKDSFLSNIKNLRKSKSTSKDLKNIYNQFFFMIIDNIDESYKNQLNLFWIDFVSPLEREIIIKNNSNFLKVRLTSLNASWNSFNVHMNKRNVKITKDQESRLEIIHRRWRSILKIVVVP